ncbi:MAG TPA: ATP-binding protein [Marinobacter sp.]|nr:ATP-binding protein [Marinobacter sp.]
MNKSATRQAPLSRKLLLLGALPAVIMFVTLMVFFTSARLEDARRDLSQSNQLLADSLAPALEYAVVAGNRAALEQVLAQSLRRSKAAWIRVSDVLGDQIGFVSIDRVDSPQDGQFNIYESEILQEPLQLGDDRDVEWFGPSYGFGAGSLKVGTVQVGVSTDLLASRRQDILWASLAVGIALLLFTIILVNHFLNVVLSPINSLSGRITKLINKQYDSEPISRHQSSREITEIQQQLNELAAHLKSLQATREMTLAASENARQKAEVANSAKTEFLSSMSHELRTPLNGVLGMIDLIQEDPLTDQQKNYLNTARQSTEDLLLLIGDILDYSQMDSGTLELENRKFDLKTIITNCAATYRHLAEQHDLTLILTFCGDWPEQVMVTGDAGRLRQILAGLMDNAIKFTGAGYINVQASYITLMESCIILDCSISDSGSGIPADQISGIFNSFYQLDSRNSRQHGGIGLGLSLVQRLVEIMGGHIDVDTNLGKGSSFRFELPFDLATFNAPTESKTPPLQRSSIQSAQALVVEDNLVNQRVATAMLTHLGFKTDAVSNGMEALALIKNNHAGYDVILMDCQMPVMDGYEATRHIREWEQSNGQTGTPIIALTADVLPETKNNCKDSGMDDYLAKPVRKENLTAVLSRWVQL